MSPLPGGTTKAARGVLALAAVALATTACSSGQHAAALSPQNPVTGVQSQAPTPPPAAVPAGPAFGGAPSAEAALSGWVTALVKGDYPGACKLMGQKGPGGSAPTAPTQALCATLVSNKGAQTMLAGMHKSFTPAGAGAAATTVVVTGVTPTGTTATAKDTQIRVDGKSLRDVIAANGKGLPAGKSLATFQISQIGKFWYVTDFALNG